MLCTVIKAFPFAENGTHIRTLEVGAEIEIADDVALGLRDAGYLALDGEDDAPAQPAIETQALAGAPENAATTSGEDLVEIPETWRDLGWHELRALAAKVSGGPIPDKASAEAALLAEIERRAA